MKPKYIFLILFLINLLNYIDRQILFAVFPLIQYDLKITDTHLGLLGSAFMIVYMFVAPVIGWLADRTPRQIWIALSAFLWSVATIFTGMAKNYAQILTARSFLGIGESGFTTVSPSFIAERFPPRSRAKILSFYGLALPLGSALGYLLGATIGQTIGWRNVFWLAGIPGIVLAVLVFFKIKDKRALPEKKERPRASQYLKLLKNKPFLFVCLAQAMGTFTLGGLAAWMPMYFHRYFNFSVAKAGMIFGAITIIAGAAGTALGGIIADRLLARTKKAYFITAALSFAAALPLGISAVLTSNSVVAIALFAAAIMFAFLQSGPLQAAIVSTTDIKIRSMAFALNIFIIHALGDALSPTAIGKLSDMYSLKTAVLISLSFIIPAVLFCYAAGKYYNGNCSGGKLP
jgi:MFS family permease